MVDVMPYLRRRKLKTTTALTFCISQRCPKGFSPRTSPVGINPLGIWPSFGGKETPYLLPASQVEIAALTEQTAYFIRAVALVDVMTFFLRIFGSSTNIAVGRHPTLTVINNPGRPTPLGPGPFLLRTTQQIKSCFGFLLMPTTRTP
jgi:hypothetical protein